MGIGGGWILGVRREGEVDFLVVEGARGAVFGGRLMTFSVLEVSWRERTACGMNLRPSWLKARTKGDTWLCARQYSTQ